MKISAASMRAFRSKVWKYYRAHGRHTLPWRTTHDPYHILVSEVMLQQTQVERVIPYFTQWMRLFPDVESLAKAPLSKVLRLWQGLGYNRRAKMLHEAAKVLATQSAYPSTVKEWQKLPGVGPYTAGAIIAFAYNENAVFIETNIRTVFLHHFFGKKKNTTDSTVSDVEIFELVEKTLPKGRAREWYAALMDYGAYLKRTGVQLNARAKGYVKQKKFQGSTREARGAVLKALVRGPQPTSVLIGVLGPSRNAQVKSQLAALAKDGMIVFTKGKFWLPR